MAQLSRILVQQKCVPIRKATHGMLWRTPDGTTLLLADKFTRERDFLNARASLRRSGITL